MSKTRMSNEELSHVALEQHLCIVCAKPIDVGLLLDTRLRNVLPSKVVTGYHETPCDECNEKMHPSDGSGDRVALVGIDESKSVVKGNIADPDNAYRTGAIAFLRVTAWEQIVNVPVPEKLVCFCDDAVIKHLSTMQSSS